MSVYDTFQERLLCAPEYVNGFFMLFYGPHRTYRFDLEINNNGTLFGQNMVCLFVI